MAGEIASFLLLAAVLAAAVVRPHGLPEAVVAVPAAGLLVLFGVVSVDDVQAETDRLLPILIFLAAVFVLAYLCSIEGLFEAAGHWLSRSSGGRGPRLLMQVFALSVATTSVLSLDATVMLLTPVVLAAATRLKVRPAAQVYATGHLANSGSLLLPMANLTNLLAIAASGLTLLHFAALMALPLVVVLVVEYLVLRLYFRAELAVPGEVDADDSGPAVPMAALVVLGCTLAGFVVASFFEIEPYWVAIGGAVALGVHSASRGLVKVPALAKAVDIPFLLFVLGLTVVVRGVVDSGLGRWVIDRAPESASLWALLAFAAIAAVLANVVNNLPALLILLGPAAAVGTLPVLAVLIGVNIGPNLTYTGSLATLLWRRVLADHDLQPRLSRFTILGLLTVPANIVLATCALWLGAQLLPFA
jgi:arsenical pump membrane protein